MSGDELTIATFIWGFAFGLALASLQSIQARAWGWAVGYAVGALALLVLGFTSNTVAWVISALRFDLGNALQVDRSNPVVVKVNQWIGSIAIIVALIYASIPFLRREELRYDRSIMSRFFDGVVIVPCILLIIAPIFLSIVLGILQDNILIFSLVGFAALFSVMFGPHSILANPPA
jgi:hypothetical protein